MVLSVTLALVGLLPRATPGRTRTGRSVVSRSGLLRLEEPSPHASLVLLRHGQSEWNLANRFTGWVDVDLTERGITEAREAGRLLAAEGLDLDECYCSSLRRAIRTSCLVLSGMDQCWVPLHKDARLNEQHSGFLTGNNKRALAEEHGVAQVMAWRRKYDEPPPPMPNDSPLQQMMVKDERYAVRRAPDTNPSTQHPAPAPSPHERKPTPDATQVHNVSVPSAECLRDTCVPNPHPHPHPNPQPNPKPDPNPNPNPNPDPTPNPNANQVRARRRGVEGADPAGSAGGQERHGGVARQHAARARQAGGRRERRRHVPPRPAGEHELEPYPDP